MPEVTLVNVATYDNPNVAHIARSRLESEGIRAVLDGEHHVAMDWMITNAVGGVKLLVRSVDRHSAIRILNETSGEFRDNGIAELAAADELAVCCPECRSTETFRERLQRKWIFLSILLLGIPIPFLSNKMICESCNHKWSCRNNVK